MEPNGTTVFLEMDHFGNHFPLKINEKNDAKIDAEKVMKNHEK